MILVSTGVRAPDGGALFQNLNASFGSERVGLAGANGIGKTTLLDLIASQRVPDEGHVAVDGRVWRLEQQLTPDEGATVADAWGVAGDLAILARVLGGDASDEDLDNADWTLESRLEAALARVGLKGNEPQRLLSTLSGGERTRVALAGMILVAPDVVLLDEPTNHLDADGRAAVAELVASWEGCLIVASHDRDLLRHMDRIVELRADGLASYGGNYDAYRAQRDLERAALEARLDHSRKALEDAKAQAQQTYERTEQRASAGKKASARGDIPKMLLGLRKSAAQQSGGSAKVHAQKIVHSRAADFVEAEAAARQQREASVRIAPTGLAAGRDVARLDNVVVRREGVSVLSVSSLHLRGPMRLGVTGLNGAGKSTLLGVLSGRVRPDEGTVVLSETAAYLDQDVSLLHEQETVRDAWLRLNPDNTVQDAQAALAGFLFRNTSALKRIGELSGGERLRAGLACVLGGKRPARLLLLDEPTNHLDLPSIAAVEEALCAYDGTLVVVSHDRSFLQAINLEDELVLTRP